MNKKQRDKVAYMEKVLQETEKLKFTFFDVSFLCAALTRKHMKHPISGLGILEYAKDTLFRKIKSDAGEK